MGSRIPPKRVRCGSVAYRLAGVKDLAALAASYLFKWMAESGVSKQAVEKWLSRITSPLKWLRYRQKNPRQRSSSLFVPEDLLKKLAEVFVQVQSQDRNVSWGDFVMELTTALDNPPPGYRWIKSRDGYERLVRDVPGEDNAPIKGQKYKGYVLIGLWWVTAKPSSRGNKSLQANLRLNRGSVFDRSTFKGEGSGGEEYSGLKAYAAFAVAPTMSAAGVAEKLKRLAKQAAAEGEGTYFISAVNLDGLAEGRELKGSDRAALLPIKSTRFNYQYTLPDLVNGKTQYDNFLELLGNAVEK